MEARQSWLRERANTELNKPHTHKRFEGYVALVTGGCSGIGQATLERFLNDGATAYALDINIQGEAEMKERYGNQANCVVLDVSNKESCVKVVKEIAAKHGNKIHSLVNCAAYFGSKGLDAEQQDWDNSFNVNVVGVANMVQAVEPYMSDEGLCSIVNMGSISGSRCQGNRWTYSATKGAIVTISRCMALDLRHKSIRVNSVLPSWTWTPEVFFSNEIDAGYIGRTGVLISSLLSYRPTGQDWVAKASGFDRKQGESKWGKYAINGRFGDTDEVAGVITFLASKDAGYVNGADIAVCGGYHAMGPELHGEEAVFAGSQY